MKLPLSDKVDKPDAQALLHAVEEMYFYRRFGEAVALVRRIFSSDGRGENLDDDTRNLLVYYESKCNEKLEDVNIDA